MRRQEFIPLNMDMSDMAIFSGNAKNIQKGESSDYKTIIYFALPFNENEFQEGEFEIKLEDNNIKILFYQAKQIIDDPIIINGKDWQIGTSGTGIPTLPFRIFTDNKGQYPWYFARITFPFRLANWSDFDHPSGIKSSKPTEEDEVTGPPKNLDKIKAIIAINILITSSQYKKSTKKIQYDEVTTFLIQYLFNGQLVLSGLYALTSQNAYKKFVTEYFLGELEPKSLHDKIDSEPEIFGQKISNEDDLLNIVFRVIQEILKHHIENRRWIQAFWDGRREYKIGDEKIELPSKPKKEPDIQPTIHVLLHEILSRFGIHVTRESDEGIGKLDFKCMYTIDNKYPISISIEFKLAHHGEVRKGLTRQLPSYLIANNSKSGIFIIMWFKDKHEKYFNEPKGRRIEDTLVWLREVSNEIKIRDNLNILTEILDASIKPSASNL